jgi:hypothetical protein
VHPVKVGIDLSGPGEVNEKQFSNAAIGKCLQYVACFEDEHTVDKIVRRLLLGRIRKFSWKRIDLGPGKDQRFTEGTRAAGEGVPAPSLRSKAARSQPLQGVT